MAVASAKPGSVNKEDTKRKSKDISCVTVEMSTFFRNVYVFRIGND